MPKTLKARYIALTEKMQANGPNLGMPHTRAMQDGLFEMRIKAQEGAVRIFFCTQPRQEIVILHMFIKKTQQTPQKEIVLARHRLKEIKYHD
ncbi:MAG: type II toxin-antitoxin system RelE/ParE family toxin [Gammaproteobacteria bacterium]